MPRTRSAKVGSSPLTRGKLRLGWCPPGLHGLIPAHAGKTSTSNRRTGRDRAHPRSRGENRSARRWASSRSGSSPLTRGKRVGGETDCSALGLIPAHAGKTRSDHGRRYRTRAHPRSRGENRSSTETRWAVGGSSPLTRGKLLVGAGNNLAGRLIPAHAGKTGRPAPRGRGGRAHPRSRGENPQPLLRTRPSRGSSPLTRGKRVRGLHVYGGAGLIPAHAGKTVRR